SAPSEYEDRVVQSGPLRLFGPRIRAPPDDLVEEVVLSESLIQHDLDVMASMPIAVVVERAGFLKHTGQLYAAGPHVIDVRLRVRVPVLECTFLLGLTPED